LRIKTTEAMVHYIRENAHLGSKIIAQNLELPLQKIINIAFAERISLRKKNCKNGRPMNAAILKKTSKKKVKVNLSFESPHYKLWLAANPEKRVLGTMYWKNRRKEVLQRDGYICAYCGGVANSVDHVIPRSAGGDHSLANLVASCLPCNGRKGNMQEHAFLARKSAPPVFLDSSLPKTVQIVPESPFDRPESIQTNAD
jgi:hypothetical protein